MKAKDRIGMVWQVDGSMDRTQVLQFYIDINSVYGMHGIILLPFADNDFDA